MRITTASRQRTAPARELVMVNQVAHIFERTSFAMAGAMSGTFVAAQLAKSHVAMLGSLPFVAITVVTGAIGFYLGIDIPRLRLRRASRYPIDAVELLSASGIFLAVLAALVSVYGIIFDEVPPRMWELVFGSWWIAGVALLIAAGVLGRQRLARQLVALSGGKARLIRER